MVFLIDLYCLSCQQIFRETTLLRIYLYDLFGVDVNKTLETNATNYQTPSNDETFVIEMKKPSNNFLSSLISTSSSFSPAPSKYIEELADQHPSRASHQPFLFTKLF